MVKYYSRNKKNIFTWVFTITLCSLDFYVEIENLKSTVITTDFDNHYDFIQIRKKGKGLNKSALFCPPPPFYKLEELIFGEN